MLLFSPHQPRGETQLLSLDDTQVHDTEPRSPGKSVWLPSSAEELMQVAGIRKGEQKQPNDECSLHYQFALKTLPGFPSSCSSGLSSTSLSSFPQDNKFSHFLKHFLFFPPSPSRNFPENSLFSLPIDSPHYFMKQSQFFPKEINLGANFFLL